jgi:hypothetical protein
MSAKNQFNKKEKNIEIPPLEQLIQRKVSIDPIFHSQNPQNETPSELSKLNKITPVKGFSKIEHFESRPSKDGMKINLMLNINFNLKGIMVRQIPKLISSLEIRANFG